MDFVSTWNLVFLRVPCFNRPLRFVMFKCTQATMSYKLVNKYLRILPCYIFVQITGWFECYLEKISHKSSGVAKRRGRCSMD